MQVADVMKNNLAQAHYRVGMRQKLGFGKGKEED